MDNAAWILIGTIWVPKPKEKSVVVIGFNQPAVKSKSKLDRGNNGYQ
jgi:hypothetical protein